MIAEDSNGAKQVKETGEIIKYVPFSMNALKILINAEIYFGQLNKLNDPFEGDFNLEMFPPTSPQQFITFYSRFLNLQPNEINDIIEREDRNIKDDALTFAKDLVQQLYGVTSFTLAKNNLLMWSHYADSHRGMCLVFDTVKLMGSLRANYPNYGSRSVGGNTVKYLNSLPTVTATFDANDEIFFGDIKEVLCSKLKMWEYEEEIRLIKSIGNKDGIREIAFDRLALSKVIFGAKAELPNIKTVVKIIQSIPEYSGVKFERAYLNKEQSGISTYECTYEVKENTILREWQEIKDNRGIEI